MSQGAAGIDLLSAILESASLQSAVQADNGERNKQPNKDATGQRQPADCLPHARFASEDFAHMWRRLNATPPFPHGPNSTARIIGQ